MFMLHILGLTGWISERKQQSFAFTTCRTQLEGPS